MAVPFSRGVSFLSPIPLSARRPADLTVCSRRSAAVRLTQYDYRTAHCFPLLRTRPRRACSPIYAFARPAKQTLPNLADTLTTLFPVWVTLGAVLAYTHPPTFLWFQTGYIVPTLSLIMLGMGLTITPASFAAVLATPRRVLLGALAQYTIMPCLARFLAFSLRLPPALAAGLILVGVCPGGAASNLVCLIAHADVALSVVLTLVSTLLSVALIPTLMQLLAGTLVPVSATGLLVSTAQVVLLPLASGALLKRLFPGAVQRVLRVLPLVSVLGVTCICGGVVAAGAHAMHGVGLRLVLAVAALHAMGGACGYALARAFRLPTRSTRTVCIEVMMQNSSLAVSLANVHFANPLTAIPGAISATMHSVFGSIMAGTWRMIDNRANALERDERRSGEGAERTQPYRILEE